MERIFGRICSHFIKLLKVQTYAVVMHLLKYCALKTRVSFEIRAYIKGGVNLSISSSQTYNELFQIHGTSAVSKTLFFQWQKFQNGFTNLKDGPVMDRSELLLPMLILLLLQA